MWRTLFLCLSFTIVVSGQFTNYQQCAANLACSINYEKILQEKINNLGYHTTLQIQTLKNSIDAKVTPLTHDIDILKTNATAIQDDVTREMQHVFRSLDHDRVFLNNLTKGIYELANELHHEQYMRFQDVHKLVEEVNLVKQALGLLNNHSNLLEAASCEAKLNATTHNATFYETQYKKVLLMYNNLQKTVHDIRNQQHVLLTQLQEKTREVSHLQKQLATSRPNNPARLTRSANCGEAIGMENGKVLDAAVSASESFGDFNPEYGRLNDGRGWYTGAKPSSKDWLKIDLGTPHVVTAVATQGAPCCEVWVTNYTLYYSNDGQHWEQYQHDCSRKYINGNVDQDKIVYQLLSPPIMARYVRFNILDFHRKNNSGTNYIGMRTELYGCPLFVPKITQPHQ